MQHPEFIAVDWGTSNCRAVLIRDGKPVRRVQGMPGALGLAPEDFASQAAKLRADLGDFPMVLAGMVGSNIGWQIAPYCPLPAAPADLVAKLLWIDKRTAIVPGLAQKDENAPDVMRGEEVQIFGAMQLHGGPADGLYCQPGTHSKWVRVEGGQITRFHTSMTGEVFALLRKHSILAPALAAEVAGGDDFIDGVIRSEGRDILGELFRDRAGSLLFDWTVERSAAQVSGLLIGSECRARIEDGATVMLVCDDSLAALYRAALGQLGVQVVDISTRDSFIAGVSAIAALAFGDNGA